MEAKLLSYVTDNQLIEEGSKTLLAVSGGIDSVVLCHLFKATKLDFGIAHCNFNLRGEASDGDESFVKNLALKLAVPFYSTSFDTEKLAQKNGQSIQVAARELRYEWLENIRDTAGFAKVATAHHLNDSIETLLYNFTKGCGIRGLHGILPQNRHLIRPLLFAQKEEIEAYAQAHQIPWREDASNATDKYARNKIRHQVVPVLQSINQAFVKTAGENIIRLRETEDLYHFAIQHFKSRIVKPERYFYKISIKKLLNCPAPKSVLFEILKPYGFNNHQVQQVMDNILPPGPARVGATFESENYHLVVDRVFLILSPNQSREDSPLHHIYETNSRLQLPEGILTIRFAQPVPQKFPSNPCQAFIDFDKLIFPLVLRKWLPGDSFQPLGMGGHHQKVQDFFSNKKLNHLEKKEVWILENQHEICWIVGHRLDERYKVNPATQHCLFLQFERTE